MDDAGRQQVEEALRERSQRGDLAGTATLAIESYGPEILGYMAATGGAAVEVEDVFAAFAAALWQALPRFRWESSFRTWAYTIARRVLLRARRRAQAHARRLEPGSEALAAVVDRVRTATAPFLRTSVRDELSRLRASLAEDEQTLLILRIDRRLAWDEIAQIFAEEGDELDDAELRRRAAALRKRFERLKARLGAQLRARRPD